MPAAPLGALAGLVVLALGALAAPDAAAGYGYGNDDVRALNEDAISLIGELDGEQRIGKAISLSEGVGAQTQLADALLNGEETKVQNVRLFNSLFSATPVMVGAQGKVDVTTSKKPELGVAATTTYGPPKSPKKVKGAGYFPNSPQSKAAKLEAQAKDLRKASKVLTKAADAQEKLKKKKNDDGLKVLVTETFSNGSPNGWTAVVAAMKQIPGSETRLVPMKPNNSSLAATDEALKGNVWYWKAPKSAGNGKRFLGAMQDALAGTLSFELKQSNVGLHEQIPSEGASSSVSDKIKKYKTFADVVLHGGLGKRKKRTLGFYFERYPLTKQKPSSSTWTKYNVPLKPVKGDPTGGAPWVVKGDVYDMDATTSHFDDVLRNLDTLMIRGRYQTAKQTTEIRNIYITGHQPQLWFPKLISAAMFFTGCPKRCANGGKVIRDRCVCQCAPGFSGEKCSQKVMFNFESLSSAGEGTGKCLTLCRPKLKLTSSGQITYLDCSEQHNSNYYSSAQPIVMLTTCGGLANQLFNIDVSSKRGTRYRSVSLRGYCLAKAGSQVAKGMKQAGFHKVEDPTLSVVMCSKTNPDNLWKQTKVRSAPNFTFRFSAKVNVAKAKGGRVFQRLCIAPHYSWNRPCADPQCNIGDGMRQGVMKGCDTYSRDNQFIFTASRYLDERKAKGPDKMIAKSMQQKPEVSAEMRIHNAKMSIQKALDKVKALQAAAAKKSGTVKKEEIAKAQLALKQAEAHLVEQKRLAVAEKAKSTAKTAAAAKALAKNEQDKLKVALAKKAKTGKAAAAALFGSGGGSANEKAVKSPLRNKLRKIVAKGSGSAGGSAVALTQIQKMEKTNEKTQGKVNELKKHPGASSPPRTKLLLQLLSRD